MQANLTGFSRGIFPAFYHAGAADFVLRLALACKAGLVGALPVMNQL